MDVDSTVITRYGEQEGSKLGYNPTKRGRNSHHLLFAFINDIKMVANCWNRGRHRGDEENRIKELKNIRISRFLNG